MGDTLCCLEGGWKEGAVKVEEDKFPTSIPPRRRPSSARPLLEDIREEGLWVSIPGGVHRLGAHRK